jgi:hypothetical protein
MLRPVSLHDTDYLYALAALAPERWWRVCGSNVPPPTLFPGVLWARALCLYLAHDPESPGRHLGLVGLYDWRPAHGSAWIEVVPQDEDDLDVLEPVMWRMVDDQARRFGLRRAYLCVPEFLPVPKGPERGELIQEGLLREYLFHDNFHWDMRVFTYVVPAAGSVHP